MYVVVLNDRHVDPGTVLGVHQALESALRAGWKVARENARGRQVWLENVGDEDLWAFLKWGEKGDHVSIWEADYE